VALRFSCRFALHCDLQEQEMPETQEQFPAILDEIVTGS
jgi:hypothetical protein